MQSAELTVYRQSAECRDRVHRQSAGPEHRVNSAECRVQRLAGRVQSAECRVQSAEISRQSAECKKQCPGAECNDRVQSAGGGGPAVGLPVGRGVDALQGGSSLLVTLCHGVSLPAGHTPQELLRCMPRLPHHTCTHTA